MNAEDRGNGLGTAMVENLIQRAGDFGCSKFMVWARHPVDSFFVKLGFEQRGNVKGYFESEDESLPILEKYYLDDNFEAENWLEANSRVILDRQLHEAIEAYSKDDDDSVKKLSFWEVNVSPSEKPQELPDTMRFDIYARLKFDDSVRGIGELRFSKDPDGKLIANLEQIVVNDTDRENQVGVEMVKTLIKKAGDFGCSKVMVWARPPVDTFFEKLGFVAKGDIDGYFSS